MKINFQDAEEGTGGFEPIPVGVYNATVFNIETKEGAESKKPYLNWTFQVQDERFANRRVWLMTSLQPNSLWRLKEVLEALGLEGDMSKQFELDIPALLGTECKIQVVHEEYQWKTSDKVSKVMPSVGGKATGGAKGLFGGKKG